MGLGHRINSTFGVSLGNSDNFSAFVALLNKLLVFWSFEGFGGAVGVEMGVMVHKRPLAEQIAFPGVSVLRSKPICIPLLGWFRGFRGFGVFEVVHGFMVVESASQVSDD